MGFAPVVEKGMMERTSQSPVGVFTPTGVLAMTSHSVQLTISLGQKQKAQGYQTGFFPQRPGT